MNESLFHTADYWVSSFNYLPEVRVGMSLPPRVMFHDATLRDGEQTPGLVFRTAEKIRIAALLDQAGVDRIEVAMPAVSDEDVRAVKGVVELKLNASIFVFARGIESDIDLAIDCGVDGIILELPVGRPRLQYQFPHWKEQDVIDKAARCAKYAKDKGLEVVLFPMDCTRARHEFFFAALEQVGALPEIDGVALVDTTGSLTPEGTKFLVRKMKGITGKRIEIHTHNDFGLGTASALAAVAAGAEVVHASVGGLGERTGNTSLEETAVSLKTLYGVDTNIDYRQLSALVSEVMDISGFALALNKPVVGRNAYTRESGMGVNLVKEQPLVLFGLHPHFVGLEANYVLGKKSGAASITMKLDDLGLPPVSDEVQAALLKAVKTAGIKKKGLVTDDEFIAIVKNITAIS
jgi:isopropylmalate/homocitrate/citramalate synthase